MGRLSSRPILIRSFTNVGYSRRGCFVFTTSKRRIDFFAKICYNTSNTPKGCRFYGEENSKRGFTLVELIVVLVILAILAALLIPALTGYIDKARKNQVVAETRALTQAVQTEMSTIYGLNNSFQGQKDIGKPLTIASKDGDYGEGKGQLDDSLKERYAEIVRLSEVPILEEEL